MLVGSLTVKSNNVQYSVVGIDYATSLRLVLDADKIAQGIAYMVSNDVNNMPNTNLWSRSVDISMSSVTVQTDVSTNEAGKKVKAPVNEEFFCRLGSFLRYVKRQCSTKNIEDRLNPEEMGISEIDFSDDISYVVPTVDGSGVLARVVLNYGNIKYLKAENDYFNIYLQEEEDAEAILPKIVDGVKKGIAFNKEYLGFDLPKIEVDVTSEGQMYATLDEVIEAYPDMEFEWLRGKNYIIVTDENLQAICDYIYNEGELVYYDTETTGLNITFKSRTGDADQCVGIILSIVDGESYFFPMQMKSIKNLCGDDHFYFMERYMRRILEQKDLVVHNASFDWRVSYIYDINANIVHDTLALYEMTLGQEHRDMPMGLKELTRTLLHRDSLELSQLVKGGEWGENDIRFWDLTAELTRFYACADTDNTRGIFKYAIDNNLLQRYNASKCYEIEVAFSLAVGYQEFYGMHIDINNVEALKEEVDTTMADLLKKMCEMVHEEFNPNSPKQLQDILYVRLGAPKQYNKQNGRVTTDGNALKTLAKMTDADGNQKYPFCSLLADYKDYESIRKVIDAFPQIMTQDGYLFSDIQQYGTTTGRVSTKKPNYQGFNDPVKKNVQPRPGYYMFDTDYSSVEYRVLGNMSGNKMIKERFYDPDFDYHTYQAARMYGVPYANVTSKLRKTAKSINFGIPYGMGDKSLGENIFGVVSEENTKKATSLRKAYFKGQEDVQDFFEKHREKGVQLGYTETYFGRRRYYDKSKFSVSSIRRQAGNAVIQGCQTFDTLIQTKEYGIVQIGRVVDKNVTLWDGKNWTKGTVVYTGRKHLCRVHFNGGMVYECSPTHKFLVRSHKGNERFVECKDLIGQNENKSNGHRVVISETFVNSDFEFYSGNKGNYSKIHNANNYSISDLSNERFALGVLLGRLASDGNYPLEVDDEHSRVVFIVAEHEKDVLSVLKTYLSKNIKYTIRELVREDRNEILYEMQIFSKSLVSELQELNLRYTINERLMQDTELIRGYLRGIFDGDGGISGKTITLVQGDHYDFYPMLSDIQKLLLFFGIRSRYRHYKGDRHVLSIRTYDNERFLNLIGFINEKKQKKGLELSVKRDEHVFGKCLTVQFVEYLDEYEDMYDVCNTDRGYYVANGVVVHNSAADIYKLAVGRVFKRICREGWLGKVLLTGFIHDELLGEVSTDIDPMQFLKVLREEFEVKIKDTNGEPWCPLYMGFGFGMSWYQAKKTEIPIKLQWELVEKYGENGYPIWDGNGKKLSDSIPDMIREFSIRDSIKQITSPEAQGNEIKPALNTEILGIIEEDKELYDEYFKTNDVITEEAQNTLHIVSPMHKAGV